MFHPGTPPLDLRADRCQFDDLTGAEILDRPTAEDVLAALQPGLDIGHFSCHGSYNALRPFASHLALETDLQLSAVLAHRHAPWLTNLSACETGIPDLQALEQLISFPTGFLLAGSAHMIATLWPVDNAAATTVNGHVYHDLVEQVHPAVAFREAVGHLRRAASTPEASIMESSASEVDARALGEDDDQRVSPRHGLECLPRDHPLWWAPFVHYGSPW